MATMTQTPEPPYYAVIFTSQRTEIDEDYSEVGKDLLELASKQPGFLGAESARGADGFGITVSYWNSIESIQAWKQNGLHRIAQDRGRSDWYRWFTTRICRVERHNAFDRAEG